MGSSQKFSAAKRAQRMDTFSATARSQVPAASNLITALPSYNAPAQQISRLFDFQSYFDDTLLQQALLEQTRNAQIVESTAKTEQISGYAIANAPWSQTPVSVQFNVGGQPTTSDPLVLMPGQIERPHGLPRGMKDGNFSGFTWGLPFGWLGGGLATIVVFQSPDSDVAWPGNAEVIFHRQRMRILAPASVATTAPKNWPLRFPWVNALRGSGSIPQNGSPQMSIAEPTRVLMSLRMTALAAPADMRILFHESSDFDLDSAGAVIATNARFVDTTWGTYAASGIVGNLNTAYPIMTFDGGPLNRLGCDLGGVQLVDLSGGTLAGQYVDVVRYGKL